jgi:hypothetical protein
VAAGDDACKQAVTAAGGLEVAVTAMRAHASDLSVQRNGCGTLWNVAAGDAACKQAVTAAGGLKVAVAAMRAHASDLHVQLNGCATLSNVAEGDAACKRAVTAAGGLEVAVAAMREHADNLNVQRGGCTTLCNVAAGDAACKQALAAAGGLEVAVAAMRLHPDNPHIQRWGTTLSAIPAPPATTSPGSEPHSPSTTLHTAQVANRLPASSTETATDRSHVPIGADAHEADALGQRLLSAELRATERALSAARRSLVGRKDQIDSATERLHAAATHNDELRAGLDRKEQEDLQLRELSQRRGAELERVVPAERQLRVHAQVTESQLAATRAELLHAQSSLSQVSGKW